MKPVEEIQTPPKKRPLTEARAAVFHMDQDRKFERLISILESQNSIQSSDVDPEVDAFVNGIAFSLQKSVGQQRERLFADIRSLIYDTISEMCDCPQAQG